MIRKPQNVPPVIIDHEPPEQFTANGLPVHAAPVTPDPQARGVAFGKRRGQLPPASALTGTFFEPSGLDSEFRKRKIRYVIPESVNPSALPLRTLAAVFAIAFAVPTAFVVYTERQPSTDIDPVTTASISPDQAASPVGVSQITMTKLLKNGISVISVNGKIENRSQAAVKLPELEIVLYDETGRNIQSWFHRMGISEIKPHQTFRFMSSAIDITGTAKTVKVEMANIH
jgi:hypothetical protein